MNIFLLVWNYLVARPLNTTLNVLLLALGISVITVLLLFSHQLQQKIEDNARGIDLVIGAKGSPLQLILANIFHIDFPTGNIKLAEAERFSGGRLIKEAIPLALGDSYQGYRIIGTNHAYANFYDATLANGRWWEAPMEVTVGATVAERMKLNPGDTFASTHGLTTLGHAHDKEFIVVGIMERMNNVVDNLILTSVQSVWEVHEEHSDSEEGEQHNGETHAHEDHNHVDEGHAHDHDHAHEEHNDHQHNKPSPLVPGVTAGDTTKEITSLLIRYRSPMAAVQLPRIINGDTNMQAASPAFETARLFSILGVGVEVLMIFAYVLIIISALSIFIALYNSLKERRYDMAIMRSMGASRLKLFVLILLEGALLTFIGSLVGLLLGHSVLAVLSNTLEEIRNAGIKAFVFHPQEWMILTGSLLLGVVCAIIPAIQAYRTDISKILAQTL